MYKSLIFLLPVRSSGGGSTAPNLVGQTPLNTRTVKREDIPAPQDKIRPQSTEQLELQEEQCDAGKQKFRAKNNLRTLPYASSKVSKQSPSSRANVSSTSVPSSATPTALFTRSTSKSCSSFHTSLPNSRTSLGSSSRLDALRDSKSSLYDSGVSILSRASSDCISSKKLSNDRLSKEKAKFFRRRVKVENIGVCSESPPVLSNLSKRNRDTLSKKRLFSELDSTDIPGNSRADEKRTSLTLAEDGNMKPSARDLNIKKPSDNRASDVRNVCSKASVSADNQCASAGKNLTCRGKPTASLKKMKTDSKGLNEESKSKHVQPDDLPLFALPDNKICDVGRKYSETCDGVAGTDNGTGSPTLSSGGSSCNGTSSGSGSPLEEGCSSSTTSSGAIVTSGHLRSLFDGLSHLYMTNDPRGCKRPSQPSFKSLDARARTPGLLPPDLSVADVARVRPSTDSVTLLSESILDRKNLQSVKKVEPSNVPCKSDVHVDSQTTDKMKTDRLDTATASSVSLKEDTVKSTQWKSRTSIVTDGGKAQLDVQSSDSSSDDDNLSSDDMPPSMSNEDSKVSVERQKHHHHHHCHHRHRRRNHHHCRHNIVSAVSKGTTTDSDIRSPEEGRKPCDHHHHHHKHHKYHFHRHHHHYHRNHSGCQGKHTLISALSVSLSMCLSPSKCSYSSPLHVSRLPRYW